MVIGTQILVILLYIFFCSSLAIRVVREHEVATEFKINLGPLSALIGFISLYLIPVFGIFAPGVFPTLLFWPAPLILLFFAPYLLLSPIFIKRLETSGTSRVENLEKALIAARWLAYFGIGYVFIMWLLYYFVWQHQYAQ
jgi:hypothetical protein